MRQIERTALRQTLVKSVAFRRFTRINRQKLHDTRHLAHMRVHAPLDRNVIAKEDTAARCDMVQIGRSESSAKAKGVSLSVTAKRGCGSFGRRRRVILIAPCHGVWINSSTHTSIIREKRRRLFRVVPPAIVKLCRRWISMPHVALHVLERPAKRPLPHISVQPQRRLLRSRSRRSWSWQHGAGSAVAKIKEESHAKPRYQWTVG